MELALEFIFVFPLLTMIAIAATDKFTQTRFIWAFSLSAAGAGCLGYAFDLAAAASAELLSWDDGGYAIFHWLLFGTFVQSLGFYVSRRKWPLTAPYLVAAAIYLILSWMTLPYHRITMWILLACAGLLALTKRRGYG